MIRIGLAFVLLVMSAAAGVAQSRIKDITEVRGVRANQLVGYGLVIGLNGTGDSLRNAPFTNQSIRSMLDRMGVNVRSTQALTHNIAAVMVTAELPPFIGRGARIDVTVSSLGDATSLQGGTLVMTPVMGADNNVYAVAQGPVAVSGFAASGKAQTLTQGVPTTGRIANGALVEREAPGRFDEVRELVIELRNPDFSTAVNIADVINGYTLDRFGMRTAQEQDLRAIELTLPPRVTPARFIAEVGELQVRPDAPARVVIDEKSGTIVIGHDVQISTVAVAHGSLTVRVTDTPRVSQPAPFSKGETAVTAETHITAEQKDAKLAIVRGTDLQTLVAGLNRIGLKPQGIIAILQAIKTAGALQADLVVQ